MWTMSDASTAVTNVPRRGCTATRFSSASRLTASRSGVRPISQLAHQLVLAQHRAGRQPQGDDPVAQLVVRALGEQPGVDGGGLVGSTAIAGARILGAVPARLPPGPSTDISHWMTRADARARRLARRRRRARRPGAHARPRAPHAGADVAQPAATSAAAPSCSRRRTCSGPARSSCAARSPRSTGSTRARGVVAGSAGNHAQSLAYAARARGMACEVFMPAEASLSKAAAVRGFGGTVQLGGESVDACVGARPRARRGDRRGVRAPVRRRRRSSPARGRSGSSCSRTSPDLATVVVPVGGGGLISGVAGVRQGRAARRARDRRAGRGLRRLPRVARGRRAGRGRRRGPTIADGIAIKRPGGLTLPLVAEWVDEFVTVAEDDVADAMVAAARAREARGRGRGRGRHRRAADRRRRRRRRRRDRGRALGRQRRRGHARRRSRGATRPRRAGGCGSSRASTTGRAASRGCSRASPTPAATSSRSTTCARRCRSTCARPASTCVLETRGEEHAARDRRARSRPAGYEIERFDGSGRMEARP